MTGSNNLRFWVKPHPALSEKKLKKGFGDSWPEEFILVPGPSSDSIPRSNIIISGMSSICLESISLGVPVIVVENISGLSYNAIPEEIPQDLWRSCRTSDDINSAIEYYRHRSDEEINIHNGFVSKIREEYFEPVTKEGVYRFLEIKS